MTKEEHALKYPTCALLSKEHAKIRAITNFLGFAHEEKGLSLMNPNVSWSVQREPEVEKLVLEYFGIDPVKLEDERREMIEALQETAACPSE